MRGRLHSRLAPLLLWGTLILLVGEKSLCSAASVKNDPGSTTTIPISTSESSTTTTTTEIPSQAIRIGNQTFLIEDRNEPRALGLSILVIGLLLLPIIIVAAIILLFPVPAIYFPRPSVLPNDGVLVTGRKMLKNRILNHLTPENLETFRGILESDVCVQRISCEIMKTSKEYNVDKWLFGIINDIPVGQTLKRKIARGAQATRNCKRFHCDPMSRVWKMFS